MMNEENLEEYFQVEFAIVGTKGVLNEESQFEVYTKEELLERLKEHLPNGEFGFSLITALKDEDKGI